MKKALCLMVVVLLSGCSSKPDTWQTVTDQKGNIVFIGDVVYSL